MYTGQFKLKPIKKAKVFGNLIVSCYKTDYVSLVKNVIAETVENNIEANPGWKWETIKLAIRSKSIQFTSRKKRSKDNIVDALYNRLKRLEEKLPKKQKKILKKYKKN